MKREQIILQELSDQQLKHAVNLLHREQKRRSDPPPARRPGRPAGRSGMHAKVDPQNQNTRQGGQQRAAKTGT